MRTEDVRRENKRRTQEVMRRQGNRREKDNKMKRTGEGGKRNKDRRDRKESTNQDKREQPEEGEEEKVGGSVNSSEKTTINHHRTQLTTKNIHKGRSILHIQGTIHEEQSNNTNGTINATDIDSER